MSIYYYDHTTPIHAAHDPGPAPDECRWHWFNSLVRPIVAVNENGVCPYEEEHTNGKG